MYDDPLPQTLDSGLSWEEELECALKALATLLRDEKTISWYEVHMSRLVPVLLYCLTGRMREEESAAAGVGQGGPPSDEKTKERVRLFKKMFAEASDELPVDLDSR